MIQPIKKVLMQRDKISANEAEQLIEDAVEDLNHRIMKGEMPFDICEEHFGLEEDYLQELTDRLMA